jgi:hypothetical protein
VTFALSTATRRLELALGPLDTDVAARMLPERSSLTASSLPLLLADEWGHERIAGSSLVMVVITDPGGPSATPDWVVR